MDAYDAGGLTFEIPNISIKEIEYAKRAREEYQKLRREFDLTVRKEFLKDISKDNDKLRELGISESDIQKLADGLVTKGYQVHHQLPLDDSGTNSFENLVLIKNDPYHKVVTNYQRHIVKGMEVGDSKLVDWPFFTANIYPNQNRGDIKNVDEFYFKNFRN